VVPIYQTAKDPSNLPPLWAAAQASWKANHPTWEYKIWSDEENLGLCKEHFPWFLKTYKSLPKTIMQVDAVRYMYMYAYGGVYNDLDAELLKPLDGLLAGRAAVLAVMGSNMRFAHSIPNAFMASVPGHPFWLHLLHAIKEVAEFKSEH
jgi:mannosyltransferase OCH1-like enzyme